MDENFFENLLLVLKSRTQGQFAASCQGLWSVLEGSRTFSLQKCKFISFLSGNHFLKPDRHENGL